MYIHVHIRMYICTFVPRCARHTDKLPTDDGTAFFFGTLKLNSSAGGSTVCFQSIYSVYMEQTLSVGGVGGSGW